MLDGDRYFAAFPDEQPERLLKLVLSGTSRAMLAAIEKEISAYIGDHPRAVAPVQGIEADSRCQQAIKPNK